MIIRRAEEQDIPEILRLLSQVLEIHAAVRPDIFVSGTTKYSDEELGAILKDETRPVYVALDEAQQGKILGYCFCELETNPDSACLVPFSSVYIDDLCVDQEVRGRHVGQQLFEYVKEDAKKRGCYEITLNVWEGNDTARAFYEKMGLHPKKTMMEYIL